MAKSKKATDTKQSEEQVEQHHVFADGTVVMAHDAAAAQEKYIALHEDGEGDA